MQKMTCVLATFFLLLVSLGIAMSQQNCTDGTQGCFVVKDYWPVKTCEQACEPEVCKRGWGAWVSQDVCCSPGVAFPEGCGKPLTTCWVVENYAVKTCKKDERRCLQGYGVWPSRDTCCYGAFKQNCTVLPEATTPCFVVDTYFPARLCTSSLTLCGPAAQQAGVQSWPSLEDCCSPGGAFQEGCSLPPPTPCWVVDSYDPIRSCRKETGVAACNRGWGVYASEDVCCSPNVAFPDGCSVTPNMTLPSTSATNSTASVNMTQATDSNVKSTQGP
ncbi:hypothetical protein CEUSTIGMA_g12408.t1 [Chlamydomonas eustigma]|uniref:Uncharacterized protein n=1 Tax=Chlamydomonas eustigma TaxID=1157962 RepID=A0A250XPI7_9CHLO|nr:hypothetical protein CEUSTIGMA_g12408.t1 [Chlamydomonas eustigma]|eukprot:GAX84987.1 hypothetical protein CEUSTIGMA_g12408.t1 [Chlamydomonas eustigma]